MISLGDFIGLSDKIIHRNRPNIVEIYELIIGMSLNRRIESQKKALNRLN